MKERPSDLQYLRNIGTIYSFINIRSFYYIERNKLRTISKHDIDKPTEYMLKYTSIFLASNILEWFSKSLYVKSSTFLVLQKKGQKLN